MATICYIINIQCHYDDKIITFSWFEQGVFTLFFFNSTTTLLFYHNAKPLHFNVIIIIYLFMKRDQNMPK